MNSLKFLVALSLLGFLSCDPVDIKNCPNDGIYTDECPCNDNMYRWQSNCYPKYENELIFKGASVHNQCLKEFLVTHNRFHPMSGFTLTTFFGGSPSSVHFSKKDDEGIYSELLEVVCNPNGLPAFQIKFLTNEITEKTETIKAKLYWWNIENQSYYDTEEDIELRRFLF